MMNFPNAATSIHPDRHRAMIASSRLLAAHQISSLLLRHGWTAVSIHEQTDLREIRAVNPAVLVIDIVEDTRRNLEMLQYCCEQYADRYVIAICRRGDTPVMRLARSFGVNGFFFLNAGGKSIDPALGLAATLLAPKRSSAPACTQPSIRAASPAQVTAIQA